MHGEGYAYGNWAIVVTTIVISLFFIFRFLPLRTSMHRRSGGALIAFIVALFTEMYGFPLTIYFLGDRKGNGVGNDHVQQLVEDLVPIDVEDGIAPILFPGPHDLFPSILRDNGDNFLVEVRRYWWLMCRRYSRNDASGCACRFRAVLRASLRSWRMRGGPLPR